MTIPRILLFDSGMGGLTVARAVRLQLPGAHLVYCGDSAGFPYGAWKEEALVRRIVEVIGAMIVRTAPHIVVIACNTASTIALSALRDTYKLPFVGTVPAIKPAAAQTRSGIIGVLATPGTVSREYTHALIHTYAYHCEVLLHGAARLAEMAEDKLKRRPVDIGELSKRSIRCSASASGAAPTWLCWAAHTILCWSRIWRRSRHGRWAISTRPPPLPDVWRTCWMRRRSRKQRARFRPMVR